MISKVGSQWARSRFKLQALQEEVFPTLFYVLVRPGKPDVLQQARLLNSK
jgi:hypothetical protein